MLFLRNNISDVNFIDYNIAVLLFILSYSWAHTAGQMKIKQNENKNVTNITHMAYNTEWIIKNTCGLTSFIYKKN